MSGVGAVIVGAGGSTRMGGVDKIFASLNGRPLVCYALAAAERCAAVDRVALVVAENRVAAARALVAAEGFAKVAAVCAGGARRQDSVLAGLTALTDVDFVLIHDAARPLLTPALIAAGLAAAWPTGAAIAAVPVVDTLKEVDTEGAVLRTVPRERLWAVQTPQVFAADLLREAHRRGPADVTDDAMLVEAIGGVVRIFPGSPRNLKVTTPDDLLLAAALLALPGS